jgi:hypothetical protein
MAEAVLWSVVSSQVLPVLLALFPVDYFINCFKDMTRDFYYLVKDDTGSSTPSASFKTKLYSLAIYNLGFSNTDNISIFVN